MMNRKYAVRRGFSFIEVMVVVAIMTVLIVVSMPLFRNYRHNRNLKSGASMVVAALRTTRGKAITNRRNHRTVLYKPVSDDVSHAICIYEDDNQDTPVDGWKSLPDFVEFSSFSTGLDRDGDVYYVEFKPDGGCKQGGHVVLEEESTADTRKIIFNNLTGRLRIEK